MYIKWSQDGDVPGLLYRPAILPPMRQVIDEDGVLRDLLPLGGFSFAGAEIRGCHDLYLFKCLEMLSVQKSASEMNTYRPAF